MNAHETTVLAVLADETDEAELYYSFDPIIVRTGLDRKQVRRAVRSLARRGFAVYARGLWTDDGEPAGAGYACTQAGRDARESGVEGRNAQPIPPNDDAKVDPT